jgi:hypothetical protein
MPRGGAKPGERRGGRQKNTPNKATTARLLDEQVAEKVSEIIGATQTKAQVQTIMRRVRAKDELEELIPVVKGHLAQFQAAAIAAGGPGAPGFSTALWDRLERWIELFHKILNTTADFQDPRLKAQLWVPPPQEMPAAPGAPAKVVRLGSSQAASRAYQQFMLAPRQKALPPPAKRSA